MNNLHTHMELAITLHQKFLKRVTMKNVIYGVLELFYSFYYQEGHHLMD